MGDYDWPDGLPERFYVVAEGDSSDEKPVWTISHSPNVAGWETDWACRGYGLPRVIAQFLCDAANEKLAALKGGS